MIPVNFGNHKPGITSVTDTGFFQDMCSVPTDKLAVDYVLTIVFSDENGIHNFTDIVPMNAVCTVFFHLCHQLIRDIAESKNLFLRNTENVIVETGTVNDDPCSRRDISSIIDDYGRISGSCSDYTLSCCHSGGYDRLATRNGKDRDILMFHDLKTGLKRRFCDTAYQTIRTSRRNNSFVYDPHGFL